MCQRSATGTEDGRADGGKDSYQLAPNLGGHSNAGPDNHVGTEKLKVGDIGVGALEFHHCPDFSHFLDDKGSVAVAFAVCAGQYSKGLFPSVMLGQPSGRFGEDNEAQAQENGGDSLDAPWHTESSLGLDKRAAIADN